MLTDDAIIRLALARIARIFKIEVSSVREDMQFGVDLIASFVSDFRMNEFDMLDDDIKRVAEKRILNELSSGALVIRTVGEYSAHMVRCYTSKPREVEMLLTDKRPA